MKRLDWALGIMMMMGMYSIWQMSQKPHEIEMIEWDKTFEQTVHRSDWSFKHCTSNNTDCGRLE